MPQLLAASRYLTSLTGLTLLRPLRHPRYRQLWLANLGSNLGTWIQSFAAAWLIASTSHSPQMTTMVQTATCAPLLLFSLFAGVLADAVDRARLLFAVNAAMLLAAACMAGVAVGGHPATLAVLLLTFVMGTGVAFMLPAWQASMSSLVEPEEIPAAATLNNLSYNLAALLGPWLGGMLFKAVGPSPLFMVNALSYLGLLLVYWRWARASGAADPAAAPRRPGWDSFCDGIACALRSPSYRQLLALTCATFFVSIAFASLLPLLVRDVLHLQAGAYGSLMGMYGGGAILAAFVLPGLRRRFGTRAPLAAAMAVLGLMLAALPHIAAWPLLLASVMAGGLAWSTIITTFNCMAQMAFPSAIRARTLSVYLLAIAAGQTCGSFLWGLLASRFGVAQALTVAGATLLACALAAACWLIELTPERKHGNQNAAA